MYRPIIRPMCKHPCTMRTHSSDSHLGVSSAEGVQHLCKLSAEQAVATLYDTACSLEAGAGLCKGLHAKKGVLLWAKC